jgi:phage-related protein
VSVARAARAASWTLASALALASLTGVGVPARAQSAPSSNAPPSAALDRWRSLSEGQKERLRSAYRALSKLPRTEQQRIVQRYQHFRSRSALQRQALREQYQAFRRLPPNERRAIRQSFERYRKLSDAQRTRMRQSLRELGQLPPAERQRFLSKLERWRELSHEQRAKVRARLKRGIRENRTSTR